MSRYGSTNFRICEYKYSEKIPFLPKSVRIAKFPDNRGPDMQGSTVWKYAEAIISKGVFINTVFSAERGIWATLFHGLLGVNRVAMKN